MSERWMAVAYAPGYSVSDAGRVRSPRKVLSPIRRGHGLYQAVSLRVDGRTISRAVHRLVLEAFVAPCPDGLQGAHLDGDKDNNQLSNLAWVTPRENNEHRRQHGTMPFRFDDGVCCEMLSARCGGESVSSLARRFETNRHTIRRALARAAGNETEKFAAV